MIRLVVLGDPVHHSRSPAIHRAALAAAGLVGTYEARRVDGVGMRAAAEEIRDGTLTGANITMPHKRLAADLADEVGPLVARIGAANTWLAAGGRLVAENTDPAGVAMALDRCGLRGVGRPLILGAGGAAAAALVALAEEAPMISARRVERAASLRDFAGVDAEVVPWGVPVPGALVVNATPIGMQGEALPAPVVDAAGGLFDMVYGDRETPASRSAKMLGIPYGDGLAMLVGQAAASFELWIGEKPDVEAMYEAAKRLKGP